MQLLESTRKGRGLGKQGRAWEIAEQRHTEINLNSGLWDNLEQVLGIQQTTNNYQLHSLLLTSSQLRLLHSFGILFQQSWILGSNPSTVFSFIVEISVSTLIFHLAIAPVPFSLYPSLLKSLSKPSSPIYYRSVIV